jgi:hypothetical protein
MHENIKEFIENKTEVALVACKQNKSIENSSYTNLNINNAKPLNIDPVEQLNLSCALIKKSATIQYLHEEEGTFRLLTFNQLKSIFANHPLTISFNKNILEVWNKYPKRREYQGINFDPAMVKSYNLFKGFSTQKVEGDVRRFLDFVFEVICSLDHESYDYLIGWITQML